MKQHPVSVVTGAVKAIADNGCAESQWAWVGSVNSELMRTSGQWCELYPRCGSIVGESLPACTPQLAIHRIEYLPGTIVYIESKGQVDFSKGLRDDSLNNSSVFFYNCPIFELT